MAAVELASTSLFSDANLKSYYKAEDTADSKGSNTLTNNNTVAFNAAKFNNGFDGGTANTNKSMSVASAISYANTNYSISLWVKLKTEIASGTYVFCEVADGTSDTSLCIDYNFNGGTPQIEVFHLRAGVASGNVTANQTLGTAVFHHMVVTWDGTTVRGYIDGASFGTPATDAGTGAGLTSGFWILTGRNLANYASAIIDDVALFDRVLSAAEVSSIYNGPPASAAGNRMTTNSKFFGS